MTHIADTKLLTHLDELDPPMWLHQDVYKLSISADVFNLCNAITNTLSEVMIPYVNVLNSRADLLSIRSLNFCTLSPIRSE